MSSVHFYGALSFRGSASVEPVAREVGEWLLVGSCRTETVNDRGVEFDAKVVRDNESVEALHSPGVIRHKPETVDAVCFVFLGSLLTIRRQEVSRRQDTFGKR